jgi:hypothetical protein
MTTSFIVNRCMPFRVRHTCDHIERRMMRAATAGIPWSETAEVTAGNKCQHCSTDDRHHDSNGTPCTVPRCSVIG